MNKQKQNILKLRRRVVLKLARQIEPFKLDMVWIRQWYIEFAKTPLQAAHEISQMRNSKLHAVYGMIKDNNLRCEDYHLHGTFFDVKFTMCIYAADLTDSIRVYNLHYNDWLYNQTLELAG